MDFDWGVNLCPDQNCTAFKVGKGGGGGHGGVRVGEAGPTWPGGARARAYVGGTVSGCWLRV